MIVTLRRKVRDPIHEGGFSGGAGVRGRGGRPAPVFGRGLADPVVAGGRSGIGGLGGTLFGGLGRLGLVALPGQRLSVHQALVAPDPPGFALLQADLPDAGAGNVSGGGVTSGT